MYCFHCMRKISDNTKFCPYCGKHTKNTNPPHHLPEGTVLCDRYLVGSSIGNGGFGITYIGLDQRLDFKVAIKEYFPSGYANRNNTYSNEVTLNVLNNNDFYEIGKKNFLQEAQNVAKFSRESGIVNVHDFFTANKTAYIIMEYLDGKNLNQYMRENGLFKPDKIIALMTPLMRSLEKMHAQGIIHRDISPDNIMYLTDGTLVLTDFGAARYFAGEETRSMSVVLKPGYAPFEQYTSTGKQGQWTDVYALCATIYKCITGKAPVPSLDRVNHDSLKKPSEQGIIISPQIENALMYGLALNPDDRCKSVSELLGLFEAPKGATSDKNTAAAKHEVKTIDANALTGDRSIYDQKTTDANKHDKGFINSGKSAETKPETGFVLVDRKTDEKKKEQILQNEKEKQEVRQKETEKEDVTKKENRKPRRDIVKPVVAVLVILGIFLGICVVNPSFREKVFPWMKQSSSTLKDKMRVAYEESKTFSLDLFDFCKINSDKTISYYSSSLDTGEYSQNDGLSDIKDASVVRFDSLYNYIVHTDGTVSCPENYSGERSAYAAEAEKWTDIDNIYAQDSTTTGSYIVGLKKDGTVVAAGDNRYGECEVSDWKDIAAITAESNACLGTKNDGTLIVAGDIDVSGIDDLAPVPQYNGIYLRNNGTVYVKSFFINNRDEVSNWKDVVQLKTYLSDVCGLKADGTVVYTREDAYVQSWTDIVAIDISSNAIVGKKSDGTFVMSCKSDAKKQSFESVVNQK